MQAILGFFNHRFAQPPIITNRFFGGFGSNHFFHFWITTKITRRPQVMETTINVAPHQAVVSSGRHRSRVPAPAASCIVRSYEFYVNSVAVRFYFSMLQVVRLSSLPVVLFVFGMLQVVFQLQTLLGMCFSRKAYSRSLGHASIAGKKPAG